MNILLNNKPLETETATLAELAAELSLPETGVAMAMANQMVPRQQWADTPLREGASVIIIKAVCGG